MALQVTSSPWQQVNMPALDLRRFLSFGLSEGVGGLTDMAVAQRGAGANMSVDIGTGEAIIQGDAVTNQGKYYVYNDATFNLTGFTAAHATLPRIDRVTLRVRDQFHGDAANDISYQVVTGTATSGATLANLTGAASIPGSQLLLANVLIPAASSSITTGNIDTAIRPVSGFGGGSAIPPGSVTEFAGASAPAGWLFCDGSPVSRTTFATLYGIIGTTYGTGDGSTTFNLPDMRGRMPVGKGTNADVTSLGANEGQATVGNRRPKHRTTINDPGHSHYVNSITRAVTNAANDAWQSNADGASVGVQTGGAVTGITAGTGNANDPLDSSPYLVLNMIIKT